MVLGISLSGSYCRLTGKHDIHEAYYGEFDQFARWTGEKNFSDVFDEPPPDPVEESEAYESVQKRRAEIRAEIEAEQHDQRRKNARRIRVDCIKSWLTKASDDQLFELEGLIEVLSGDYDSGSVYVVLESLLKRVAAGAPYLHETIDTLAG